MYKQICNPETDGYEVADKFIAGNVIGKADRIEAFLRENPDHAPARESLEALREATPKPIAFDDLDFNLGERWIPKGVYERFGVFAKVIEHITDDAYNRQGEFRD